VNKCKYTGYFFLYLILFYFGGRGMNLWKSANYTATGLGSITAQYPSTFFVPWKNITVCEYMSEHKAKKLVPNITTQTCGLKILETRDVKKYQKQTKTNSVALSPRANYTD
jgi:hypothetical protein